ncbi:ArsR/SmtB family transcription factor [Caldiplasma sukawensis]
MDDIDFLLSIFENTTRRRILRRLLTDSSYALEISRDLGISQQAINKQLEILEKANLVISEIMENNPFGPPRKLYRPTGFTVIHLDYMPSFVSEKAYNINETKDKCNEEVDFNTLENINKKIENLEKERINLLIEKDSIIRKLKIKVIENVKNPRIRELLIEYLDGSDEETLSQKYGIDKYFIEKIIHDNLNFF